MEQIIALLDSTDLDRQSLESLERKIIEKLRSSDHNEWFQQISLFDKNNSFTEQIKSTELHYDRCLTTHTPGFYNLNNISYHISRHDRLMITLHKNKDDFFDVTNWSMVGTPKDWKYFANTKDCPAMYLEYGLFLWRFELGLYDETVD